MGFPLIQKTTEMCVDRQIKVLGSYWKGCMPNEEANSQYKYTVREYHDFYKWDAGGTPAQAIDLQEMGVDGQGSRETGGSDSDLIFFMKYPISFLQYWYTGKASLCLLPWVLSEEECVVCERETSLSFIIYQDYTVSHLLRLVDMYA